MAVSRIDALREIVDVITVRPLMQGERDALVALFRELQRTDQPATNDQLLDLAYSIGDHEGEMIQQIIRGLP